MRLPPMRPAPFAEAPLWPPVLATLGPGARSDPHAHHGMHIVLAVDGELRARLGVGWQSVAGVVTAPDTPHALDGSTATVLLVFVDPESDVGEGLRAAMGSAVHTLTSAERDVLGADADPMAIMGEAGTQWTRRTVEVLGGHLPTGPRRPSLGFSLGPWR